MSKRAREPYELRSRNPKKARLGYDGSNSNSRDEEDVEETSGIDYKGGYDSAGRYHGMGELTIIDDAVTYTGEFSHGNRHGEGTLTFPDGARMIGTFKDDVFEGEGRYENADGSYLCGTWIDGELQGQGKEIDEYGDVVYEGEFKSSLRHGKGVLHFPEGTKIEGDFKDDVVHGDCTYSYPDDSTLRGNWRDGKMVSAKYFLPNSSKPTSSTVYCFDESTKSHLSNTPLIPDPYEEQLVYVKKSSVPGAGEGLFARVSLEPNTICSMYNGIRISLKDADKKSWLLNANNISLNNGLCVDIPPEFNDTNVYCASLGHKANHWPKNNAAYDKFFHHPRFGKIKCIRTIETVKKDEEIFVDYGYKKGTGPLWYRSLQQ